jgi:hypothetical protein
MSNITLKFKLYIEGNDKFDVNFKDTLVTVDCFEFVSPRLQIKPKLTTEVVITCRQVELAQMSAEGVVGFKALMV